METLITLEGNMTVNHRAVIDTIGSTGEYVDHLDYEYHDDMIEHNRIPETPETVVNTISDNQPSMDDIANEHIEEYKRGVKKRQEIKKKEEEQKKKRSNRAKKNNERKNRRIKKNHRCWRKSTNVYSRKF